MYRFEPFDTLYKSGRAYHTITNQTDADWSVELVRADPSVWTIERDGVVVFGASDVEAEKIAAARVSAEIAGRNTPAPEVTRRETVTIALPDDGDFKQRLTVTDEGGSPVVALEYSRDGRRWPVADAIPVPRGAAVAMLITALAPYMDAK